MPEVKGEHIVKEVFGGSLYSQGRGFYVTLELLAILRGSLLLEGKGELDVFLAQNDEPATYLRPTHDFARRLVAGTYEGQRKAEREEFVDDDAAGSLRALLDGLRLPIPGSRGASKDWRKWHFYPYPGDFIHYDALERKLPSLDEKGKPRYKINVERDSYRGGGGLAHKILRSDPNAERLFRTRQGFRDLLKNGNSPLSSLAQALSALDEAQPEKPTKDPTEGSSKVLPSPWLEQIRDGVARIVTRKDIPDSKRLETLMHWVPFCVARHQQSRAYVTIESDDWLERPVPVVFDCQHKNTPVRDRAREDLRKSTNAVYKALEVGAQNSAAGQDLLTGPQNWRTGPRTFFSSTCFAVGALNASTGIRWFTIKPELLESIVIAKVDNQMSLQDFRRKTMLGELGMVVGMDGARDVQITDIDQSTFKNNAIELGEMLNDLGLLERYSDTNEMVGIVV